MVQQIAAVVSEIASAANMPCTPNQFGRNMAKGIKSITFRSSAMKIDIFAFPRATNIFWHAR